MVNINDLLIYYGKTRELLLCAKKLGHWMEGWMEGGKDGRVEGWLS